MTTPQTQSNIQTMPTLLTLLKVHGHPLNPAFYWVNDTASIAFENNHYIPQPFRVESTKSDTPNPEIQLHVFIDLPLESPLWQQGNACLQKDNACLAVTLQTVCKHHPKAAIHKHTYQVTAMHANHTQLILTLVTPHHLHEISVSETYQPETYPHLFHLATQGVTKHAIHD